MNALALLAALAVSSHAAPLRGVDTAALDRSAAPCADFYRFACGGWLKANPIPPDQSRWGRFNELAERTKEVLRGVLEEAAASPQDDSDRRIGALYGACMDEAAVEARGLAPVSAGLAEVDGLPSAAALAPLLARLHRAGVDAGFS
ncbi:MAG: M13 family peptidase, partial [Elusimicrobia bacterium]|nr:M13 family peptidase [Elusimicrobiota bacterium]